MKTPTLPRTLAAPFLFMLAACSGGASVPNPFDAYATPAGQAHYAAIGRTFTMQFITQEGPQQAQIELTTANPQLLAFARLMVSRGYYNGLYFYDQVPGSFVLTGKARLSGQPTTAGPYIDQSEKKLPDAGTFDVGMVTHADGTVGPELIIRYGPMLRDQDLQPQNVRIGKITGGAGAFEAIRKGDTVENISFAR